jgi:hypothetical protein
MEIRINGKAADITLENERTLGELLAGVEAWLGGSEFCVSGLGIDGEYLGAAAISAAFERPLEALRSVDIQTAGRGELSLEALSFALHRLRLFAGASPEERRRIGGEWEQSAAASFLSVQAPDLGLVLGKTFSGEGLSPEEAALLIEERLREITGPLGELQAMEAPVGAIAQRMEDLPLDIQTGKDRRAAETVSLFSTAAEKLIRLFFSLRSQGALEPSLSIDALPAQSFLEEFNTALRELLAAYEGKDAVLVGDIAEYELAPRLRALYAVLKSPAAALA